MNSLTTLSPQQLRRAAQIKERLDGLQNQFNHILRTSAENSAAKAPRKKRKISAAGIARIKAAQKARWAKGKPAVHKLKRKMSAAARAKIAAAAKARWAKIKAAGRKRL